MWYEIRTVDGNSSFIQVDEPIENQNGKFLRIENMIMPVPMGENKMGFFPFDKISPLAESTKQNTRYIVVDNIISFAKVNENSKIWEHVKNTALNESGLIVPNKRIATGAENE